MKVLELARYRKKPQRKAVIPNEPRWYCIGCESRAFQILATGEIYCDGCKAPIDTIKAVRA